MFLALRQGQSCAAWARSPPASRRGSVIGLKSPGYQFIMARLDEYAQHVEELRLGEIDRESAEQVLDDVKRALEFRIVGYVPYSKLNYALGSGPDGVAFDGANIWPANWGSDTVSKR